MALFQGSITDYQTAVKKPAKKTWNWNNILESSDLKEIKKQIEERTRREATLDDKFAAMLGKAGKRGQTNNPNSLF